MFCKNLRQEWYLVDVQEMAHEDGDNKNDNDG